MNLRKRGISVTDETMGWDANLRNVAAAGGGGESARSLCWSHGHAAAGEEPAEQQLPESRHLDVLVDLTLLDGLIAAYR